MMSYVVVSSIWNPFENGIWLHKRAMRIQALFQNDSTIRNTEYIDAELSDR